MKGTVKSFDEGKGYGFIEGEDGKEYLVHFTTVKEVEQKLERDMRVEFDPVETPKGPQATEVKKAEDG